MSNPNYGDIAKEARRTVLRLIYSAQTSHIGSNFSAIDIMAVLFEKFDWNKDKFVLSAGWKAASLYYFLWKYGRITEEELNSYCQEVSCPYNNCDCGIETGSNSRNICFRCGGTGKVQSKFIGLSEPVHPDISIAGGSMGLGICGAAGLALAKKLKGEEGKVYVLMSDGEMAIGTTHESALIARQHNLNNLVVIIDKNGFQAMGETEKILSIEPLASLWNAWGWDVRKVNGHDYKALDEVFAYLPDSRPTVVIANTTKGKGVSWMENNNLYHYKNLSEEEYQLALKELNDLY